MDQPKALVHYLNPGSTQLEYSNHQITDFLAEMEGDCYPWAGKEIHSLLRKVNTSHNIYNDSQSRPAFRPSIVSSNKSFFVVKDHMLTRGYIISNKYVEETQSNKEWLDRPRDVL